MPQQRGVILLMTGAKGGAGKSTLAASLAVSLLRETRGRVLLADLDLTFCGDACQSLGVEDTGRTISDLIPLADAIMPSMLKGSLHRHNSGLYLLNAYHRREELGQMQPGPVAKVLAALEDAFDVVVVDMGTGLGALHLACLEVASHVFAVLTPDVLAIRQTVRFLDTLRALSLPSQMQSVILNRAPVRSGNQEAVVAAKLGRPLAAVVGEAPDLFQACLARGLAIQQAQPRHPACQAMDTLAANLWATGLARPAFQLDKAGAQGLRGNDAGARLGGLAPAPGAQLRQNQPHKPDRMEALKLRIHQRLLEEIDLKRLDMETAGDPEKARKLRMDTKRVVDRLLDQEAQDIHDRGARQMLASDILDEALGLGPLEKLLADESVTEIMCNGPRAIFAERKGRIQRTNLAFLSERHMRATIDRIVSPLGRRIDELQPMVNARLSDGSRVNAVIPPLAVDGPLLTIRKFSSRPLTVDDLVKFGSLTRNIAELLRCCVQARLNILISGGTGSGKTTLLNVLSSFIPDHERIVTVEDSAELQLQQTNLCRLESRPKSLEGTGEITIRDLVVNALRMRPDRIVVGECRHSEALDMLQAMNTGHDGSLTTLHANSPGDALRRLETLVMFAGTDLPSRAVREQIASGIHIVVQQSRQPDGSRKITQVSEVTGVYDDQIDIQDIFRFDSTGLTPQGQVLGRFVATGYIPRFMTVLEAKGFPMPRELFLPTQETEGRETS